MSARGILAGLLVICLCRAAAAKCMLHYPEKVKSASGKYSVTILSDRSVVLDNLPEGVQTKWKLRYGLGCHHLEVDIDKTEQRLVISDIDEGVWIYAMDGTLIEYRDGDSFMTDGHARQDQWACHPEGYWLKHADIVDGEVALTLADGSLAWMSLGLEPTGYVELFDLDEYAAVNLPEAADARPRRNQDVGPAIWVALFVGLGHGAAFVWMAQSRVKAGPRRVR